jgi:hypothetical protein
MWLALDYFARPVPSIDVSAEPQYASIMGKRFRTQRDLIAIGYTIDRNYKKQIDYVALVGPPGFSGPEVVAKSILPKGALLEVVGVLKADSWLLTRIEYVVRRRDADPPLNGTMVLNVDEESSRNYGLSEDDYAPVKSDA